MRVFKFGGASVKDAKGVKNLVSVLKKVGYNDTLIVVSAMGKTTNALEVVLNILTTSQSCKVHCRKLKSIITEFH